MSVRIWVRVSDTVRVCVSLGLRLGLLRIWRHLLEMCILLFIILDARPHAIHLRLRNLY